jgi:hypothetical protein
MSLGVCALWWKLCPKVVWWWVEVEVVEVEEGGVEVGEMGLFD